MQIELTPEQDRYLRDAIDSGLIEDQEHALQEAIALWMNKEKIERFIQEIHQIVRREKTNPEWHKLNRLLALATSAFEIEITDDPFHAFEEWNGDADRKAYADL